VGRILFSHLKPAISFEPSSVHLSLSRIVCFVCVVCVNVICSHTSYSDLLRDQTEYVNECVSHILSLHAPGTQVRSVLYSCVPIHVPVSIIVAERPHISPPDWTLSRRHSRPCLPRTAFSCRSHFRLTPIPSRSQELSLCLLCSSAPCFSVLCICTPHFAQVPSIHSLPSARPTLRPWFSHCLPSRTHIPISTVSGMIARTINLADVLIAFARLFYHLCLSGCVCVCVPDVCFVLFLSHELTSQVSRTSSSFRLPEATEIYKSKLNSYQLIPSFLRPIPSPSPPPPSLRCGCLRIT
jgi:hypothetical protein